MSRIRSSRAKRGTERGHNFRRVSGANVQRSVHNLSYTNVFTCDMGQLIPIICEDVSPGDFFRLGASVLVRDQPLVHPIMHERNVYAHYAFVPYRLLDDTFEEFYTKGVTGDYEGTLEDYMDNIPTGETANNHMAMYSMWDYLGQAISGYPATGSIPANTPPAATRAQRGFTINAFIKQAFNFFYNEYFRDNDFINPVDINQGQILKCAWEKDYFTAAARKQQRGTSPSFQITQLGLGTVYATNQNYAGNITAGKANSGYNPAAMLPTMNGVFNTTGTVTQSMGTGAMPISTQNPPTAASTQSNMPLRVKLFDATAGFNINDLRQAVQLQLWMELSQRGGVRFTEFLQIMFGISPRDDRLDRPEYIGGFKQPMVVSEVLQTSGGIGGDGNTENTSPQGNLAGHGISLGKNKIGNYLVKEPGLIIGFMSVRPRTVYFQGVDKMYTHETPFDFIFPTFTHNSERAIKKYELYCPLGDSSAGISSFNNETIGFIPVYDEYRYRKNRVSGQMRMAFNTWHLARNLTSGVAINKDFIEMTLDKRIYAVPKEPGLVVTWANHIIATRTIPALGNPGRLDHT